MRDARCGMRDMLTLDAFDEDVELSAQEIELRLEIAEGCLVHERSCFKEPFEVIDRFVAGGLSENRKANEFLFVTATAIAFGDIRPNRFHRPPNLACLFVHLELRQLLKRHAMHPDRGLLRQLPNLKVAIVHLLSRIPNLTSRTALEFIFEQDRHPLWSPLVVLEREQGENVRHGRFQFRNDPLHLAAEISVENHSRNANRKTSCRIDQRRADTTRKHRVTLRPEV